MRWLRSDAYLTPTPLPGEDPCENCHCERSVAISMPKLRLPVRERDFHVTIAPRNDNTFKGLRGRRACLGPATNSLSPWERVRVREVSSLRRPQTVVTGLGGSRR